MRNSIFKRWAFSYLIWEEGQKANEFARKWQKPILSNYFKYRNYDPIKFEVFHENTNWILEDEPTNWTMEELETFQNELAACTIQDNQNDIS